MAWVISKNNIYSTQAAAIYALKVAFTTAGWTVQRSSDGTTVSNADLWASPANVVTNSWIRLQAPNAVREVIFQLRATGETRFVYSAAAKFTLTPGTNTTVATATDGQNMNNTSTPGLVVPEVTLDHVCHIWMGGASEGYAWTLIFSELGSGIAQSGIGIDVLSACSPSDQDQAIAWRIHYGDNDADAFLGGSSAIHWWRSFGSTSPAAQAESGGYGWYRKNLAGVLYRGHAMFFWMSLYSTTQFSHQLFGSPGHYGDDQGLSAFWGRLQAEGDGRGIKGASGFFRLHGGGGAADHGRQSNGVLIGSKTRIRFGCVSLPWDGGEVLV